jgi:hypothetical protein
MDIRYCSETTSFTELLAEAIMGNVSRDSVRYRAFVHVITFDLLRYGRLVVIRRGIFYKILNIGF